jgi:hypothetical protein
MVVCYIVSSRNDALLLEQAYDPDSTIAGILAGMFVKRNGIERSVRFSTVLYIISYSTIQLHHLGLGLGLDTIHCI